MFDFLKAPRRSALRETPLSEDQWRIVLERVPLTRALAPDEKVRLGGLVQIFLDEKNFEGAGGFTMTDEVKLVIAAEACLLLVRRDVDVPYPDLASVVVYPSAWKTKRRERAGGGAVLEQESVHLGESWSKDLVVLSWDRVRADAQNATDGHNVVLHEFAHQLDAEDGTVDGAPELPDRKRYARWANVFQPEFEALVEGHATDIDRYGATNPAEFFAVVTEEFYEQPHALAENHPALFAELVKFYGFDPRQRRSRAPGYRPRATGHGPRATGFSQNGPPDPGSLVPTWYVKTPSKRPAPHEPQDASRGAPPRGALGVAPQSGVVPRGGEPRRGEEGE